MERNLQHDVPGDGEEALARAGEAVLDGQHLEDGPLATVHFDHPIPVTFHGGFSATR